MVCPTGTQGMAGKTISEKILSAKAGVDARAGDVVVCRVDCAMGTDGSAPMAIDYFEAMGGGPVRDAARMVFALDHYAPAPNRAMALLHQRLREFAGRFGIELWDVATPCRGSPCTTRSFVRAAPRRGSPVGCPKRGTRAESRRRRPRREAGGTRRRRARPYARPKRSPRRQRRAARS